MFMGHSRATMLDEFNRYRKSAILFRIFGVADKYKEAAAFAAAFLEAAFLMPV